VTSPKKRHFQELTLGSIAGLQDVIIRAMLLYIRQHSWFAWLGLLAFASQLVLTMGHVHAERESSLTRAHFAQFVRHFDADHHAVAPAELTGQHREMPGDRNDLGASCAYCWTIAQAASLILHSPARIKHDRLHQAFRLPHRITWLLSGDQTAPFESRGPPLTSKA
jgi:hypothetical protein